MPTRVKRRPPARRGISDQLREIIASRDLTAYGIGRDAGVAANVIQRFLNNERDIRLDTLDRIAAVLKLRLVEVALPTRRRPPAGPELQRVELPEDLAVNVVPECSSDPEPSPSPE